MRRAWDWFVALVLVIVSLMVVWALLGRDLVTDVLDLTHAVVTSAQPVDMVIPPCVTENSPGPCYWDADTMGNGEGVSFNVDAFGNVTRWP